MSTDYLKLIPKSPIFVPHEVAQAAAVAELQQMLPEGEEYQAEVYDHITFIDQGENIVAIICPRCGKRNAIEHFVEKDTIRAWWYDLCEILGDGVDATKVSTRMPCCRKSVAATELTFDWPAGFARFELSIMEPNIAENLDDAQAAKLAALLGCELLQVRAHY